MLALLLAHSLFAQGTQTIVLENGRVLKDIPAEVSSSVGAHAQSQDLYWGTSDTFLDGTAPLENNGDSHVLEGGPQRTILIKFGDLERFGRKHVVKATLFLTPSVGGKPHLSSIRSVLVPWGEGPLRRPFFTDKPMIAADWSATWKSRHSGFDGMDWQQNGATGPGDSVAIDGATTTDNGKEIAINGLEGAVQKMIDRWYDNDGFALTFSTPTEFFSSKNITGKPRLVLDVEDAPPVKGADLSVTLIEAKYDGANPPMTWPRDGSNVTYVAHVKNLGDAAADSFIGSWSVGEKLGSGVEIPKRLAPGEETTIELKRTYKVNNDDHRVQPLGFLIKPKGTDAWSGDDYLEVQENAIPIDVYVRGKDGGSNAVTEDLVQQEFRFLNDAILAKSRFSFAPEGALERFRVGRFVDRPADDDKRHIFAPVASLYNRQQYRQLLNIIGLLQDYGFVEPVTSLEGKPILRDAADRWPGLMGAGFSANEISVPGEIQLPYEAIYNEVFDQYDLQPSWLLGASEVAALNANLGKPLSSLKSIGKLPGTVLIRAMDRDGNPLPNTELRFYQSDHGRVPTDSPTFRLVTGANGSVLLPTRVGADGKSDQFGGLLPDASNGVYLVSASLNGVTDTAWIKAWQLSDSFARTGKPAVFTELRFNFPFAPVDDSKNLAEGAKIVNSSGEALTALADGSVQAPAKVGQWFEIDLGKDQPVTEIDVYGGKGFWKAFDIKTYFTGEKIEQASNFGHEVDYQWNLKTRPDGAGYLAYRGSGRSVRFIRFVCRDAALGNEGPVEVKVFGARQ